MFRLRECYIQTGKGASRVENNQCCLCLICLRKAASCAYLSSPPPSPFNACLLLLHIKSYWPSLWAQAGGDRLLWRQPVKECCLANTLTFTSRAIRGESESLSKMVSPPLFFFFFFLNKHFFIAFFVTFQPNSCLYLGPSYKLLLSQRASCLTFKSKPSMVT